MKKCPKCKFENQEDSTECPRCGLVYNKYRDPLADQETNEESVPAEDVQIQEKAQAVDDKKERRMPKEEPYVVALDFLKRHYYGVAVALFLVLIVIIWSIYSAITQIEGKTGIVSWTNMIGEDAETALLFDTIDLLTDPVLPNEEMPLAADDANYQDASFGDEAVLCRMPSRTPVKVLKNEGEFLRIKVLNGKCSGNIGYIQTGHFEKK